MFRGPEVQPFAVAPRVTVVDTMPVHNGEPPMSLEAAAIRLHNPLQSTPENLAKGKVQFNTYCAPCHGTSGVGNAPALKVLSVAPNNLLTGASKELTEGYIYGVIRNGVRSMPSYAGEIPPEQRWQTVLYVKDLQASWTSGKVATGK